MPDEAPSPSVTQSALTQLPVPVLCYGLGPVGLLIAKALADRPGAKIIGAVDIAPCKVGADVGELLGRARLNVTVAPKVEQAQATGVVIHATGSRLADVEPQLADLLEHGWNVLSTCEQLVYPQSVDAVIAQRLDDAARRRKLTLLGAGINPGFLLDALVLVLSGACQTVRHVHVRRVVDTNARRIPLQHKAGVGLSSEEFAQRAKADGIGHVGLRQSAFMVADRLGWHVEGYQERIEPVIAEVSAVTGLGWMKPGTVIGQRQRASVIADGREVMVYDLQMSAGGTATDCIDIDGDPAIRQRIDGGINGDAGTAAVIANLVPVVAAAEPGLLTMAQILPLSAGAIF